MCVKANQGRLYRWIEQQWQANQAESVYQTQEQSHGRIVQWRVSVFKQLGVFAREWAGLKACIGVERRGIRAGHPFCERQYYISSVDTTAEQFHQLHLFKDVTFNEDHAPQRGRFASANWSVVRNFFITLARSLGFTSIAAAKRKLANQLDKVFSFLQ